MGMHVITAGQGTFFMVGSRLRCPVFISLQKSRGQTEFNTTLPAHPNFGCGESANFGCSKLKIRENTRKPVPENAHARACVCGFALIGRFRVPVFGCFEKQIPEFRVAKIHFLTTRKKHPKFRCAGRVVA